MEKKKLIQVTIQEKEYLAIKEKMNKEGILCFSSYIRKLIILDLMLNDKFRN